MAQLKELIVNGPARVVGNIYGTLKGNADTATSATKATQDASGNVITSTYATKSALNSVSSLVGDTAVSSQITNGTNTFIKGLSVSGRTITYTKGDGTTGTITTQDTNTTYSNATTSAAGLMSKDDKAKLDAITASADSVSFSRSLTSGTKVGTITINGTGTDLYAPTNTDTHYTTGLKVGASNTATANAAASNGSVYLNVLDNTTVRDSHKITGSGATTVTSDANGVITISSTNTTYSTATTSANGLMSSSDKSTLNNLNTLVGDTAVSSQISSAVSNCISGLSISGKTITYTKKDGSTGTITTQDTNTTYSNMKGATSSAAGTAGLVPAPAAGKQTSFLRGDGTWVVPTNTTYSNMTGATTSAAGASGLVPAPAKGAATRYLRSDGTWQVPPDTNTTYSVATTSANGLMSSSDKSKLDGIATGANKTTVDSSLSSSSTNPVQNKVVNTAISNLKTLIGDTAVSTQISNAVNASMVQIDLSGAASGSAVTNNADTLGGKTLAQIESQISNATTNSTSRTWTVSVPSSGWTTGSLTFMGITCTYKNVVSVAGMTSDVSIDLVKYNSGDVTAARSYICQDTGSGTVTFWAKSALATFSVKLTEVR